MLSPGEESKVFPGVIFAQIRHVAQKHLMEQPNMFPFFSNNVHTSWIHQNLDMEPVFRQILESSNNFF
jgi:hypothetical protein